MKKSWTLIALLLLILSASLSARAPWIGGYRISFDGYERSAPLAADEHMGVHLYVAPLGWKIADPLLSVGVQMPIYNSAPGPLLEGAIDLRLFHVHNHLLSSLFRRPSSWRPTLQVGVLTPTRTFDSALMSVSVHPLQFFFGEKSVSVLAPRLIYEFDSGSLSWGIRLLEISHALF